jgi:hypothetical protein
MSSAQIKPAFVATYYSTARRALSDHSPCRLPCAAHPGSPSCMLPKSLYNSAPPGKLLGCNSKAFGSFFHFGPQSHTRPLAETTGTEQSKPIACWLVSERMTKVHPIPVSSSQAHFELVVVKCRSRAGVARLFFEPGAYRVTSHAESASEATQAASFFVCAQDFLALLLRVTIRQRVIATTAATVVAVITLFSISGLAIADDIVTIAMAAL